MPMNTMGFYFFVPSFDELQKALLQNMPMNTMGFYFFIPSFDELHKEGEVCLDTMKQCSSDAFQYGTCCLVGVDGCCTAVQPWIIFFFFCVAALTATYLVVACLRCIFCPPRQHYDEDDDVIYDRKQRLPDYGSAPPKYSAYAKSSSPSSMMQHSHDHKH